MTDLRKPEFSSAWIVLRMLSIVSVISALMSTACAPSFCTASTNLSGGTFDSEIYDLVSTALKHDFHDILPDIVEVARHRSKRHFAPLFIVAIGEVGLQRVHRLDHRPSGNHHLGEKKLSACVFLSHHGHGRYQGRDHDVFAGNALGDGGFQRLGQLGPFAVNALVFDEFQHCTHGDLPLSYHSRKQLC